MSDLQLGDSDTIVAIATAPGSGGIGIVRLSGSKAFAIAEALTGQRPEHRIAKFTRIADRKGALLDQGLLILFPAPRSFTGDDIAELHCHGGPVLLRTVLRECQAQGARQAAPGEFSQRAFLNGKIDLLQAEAIADLINSSTEAAARSASRSLNGEFSTQINAALDELTRLRVFVEAAIDFPEEEVDFIAESDVAERLKKLSETLATLLQSSRRGRTLRDGLKLVIAGAPNAGKSSLLNQLSEQDSAIVTDIPGTTRDVLREYIQIDGLPLHIVDTAGLRETGDAVEREGIRRAQAEMRSADRILFLIDSSTVSDSTTARSLIENQATVLPADIPITLVWNKCDLSEREPAINETEDLTEIALSARTGAGLSLLRDHLLQCAGMSNEEQSDISARERHVRALEECEKQILDAQHQLAATGAAELVAEDLRYAQDSLGKITGKYTSDALLGEIFGSFCIGK